MLTMILALLACTDAASVVQPMPPGVALPTADIDHDGYPAGEDCDDRNAHIHPGAQEECDAAAVDEDCNGLADDDDPGVSILSFESWYPDADGDGHGDRDASPLEACHGPEGFVESSDDCDDTQAFVHPGAEEVCGNGFDDQCDGESQECGLVGSWFLGQAQSSLGEVPEHSVPAVMANVGDVNGDGRDDLLVGDSASDWSSSGAGLIVVHALPLAPGSAPLDGGIARIGGMVAGESAGYDVDGLGDIDDDGHPDAVIGAPAVLDSSLDPRAYLVFGPLLGDVDIGSGLVWTPELVGGDLGYSVMGPGDLSGDGLPDLALAVLGIDDGASKSPAVALMFGPLLPGVAPTMGARIALEPIGVSYGPELADVGDIDGDGLADLMAGLGGVAWIFQAPLDGDRTWTDADVRIDVGREDHAAWADGGDGNGDGSVDILVGNASFAEGSGAAWVFEGPLRGPSTRDDATARVETTWEGVRLGCGVAWADPDADGVDDVVVGADRAGGPLGEFRGEVYLFYGPIAGNLANWEADAIISGTVDSSLGHQMLSLADTDGDGFNELAVSSAFPAVHVFEGGPGW